MFIICISPLGHLILACIDEDKNYFLRLAIISSVTIMVLIIYTYFYGKYSSFLKNKSVKLKKVFLENGKGILIPKYWTLENSENLSYIYNENKKIVIFQIKNIIDCKSIFSNLEDKIEYNVLSNKYRLLEILSVEKISNNMFMGEVKICENGKIKCVNYFIIDNMQFISTSLVNKELLLDIIISYD